MRDVGKSTNPRWWTNSLSPPSSRLSLRGWGFISWLSICSSIWLTTTSQRETRRSGWPWRCGTGRRILAGRFSGCSSCLQSSCRALRHYTFSSTGVTPLGETCIMSWFDLGRNPTPAWGKDDQSRLNQWYLWDTRCLCYLVVVYFSVDILDLKNILNNWYMVYN